MPKIKEEFLHQRALVAWFRIQYKEIADLLIGYPAGAQDWGAHKGEIMKQMGLTKDVPDLLLFVARDPYHGLMIEVKTKIGVARKSQKKYHERLIQQGYKVDVCYGWLHGAEILKNYLNLA